MSHIRLFRQLDCSLICSSREGRVKKRTRCSKSSSSSSNSSCSCCNVTLYLSLVSFDRSRSSREDREGG